MTPKMTVLCLKDTGHVLAAVTEAATGPAKLEQLVGSAFPLRSSFKVNAALHDEASFSLPPSMLEVKSVPLDGRAIAQPQSFVVNGGAVVQLSMTANAPTITPKAGGSVATVAFGGGNVGQDTKAVAIVRSQTDNADQRLLNGVIPAGQPSADLNFTIAPGGPVASLTSGACWEAVAASGKRIAYDAKPVP